MGPSANLQGGSLTYDWLVLNTILRMRDAKAKREWYKYWVHFKFAMQLLIPYLDLSVRRKIETEYQRLLDEIEEIENQDIAQTSKEKLIEDLRVNFAEAHEMYILSALGRVGIVKVGEDGVLNFNDFNFDNLRAAINQTTYRKAVEDKEKVEEDVA